MDTTKDTKMQLATDVAIVPEATAEFIVVLLKRIYRLEADLEEEECNKAAILDCLNEWKALAKSAEKERDDLLKALEWMVLRAEEGGYPGGKCLEEARAAIAKATGESK